MRADYFVTAFIFGLLGWGISEYMKASERKRVHAEVQDAIASLRKKGFDVTFNRLAGFDEKTAWEMEKVRSAGYTVTQGGKPITISKQPS